MTVPTAPSVNSLAFLTRVDPAALSPSELVDAVIASERLLAQVNAVQSQLLAELGRPQRCGDVSGLVQALVDKGGAGRGVDGEADAAVVAELVRDRSVGLAAAEVAAVLDWSPITSRIRIEQSTRLATALPQTLAALHRGRIDIGRVRMIVDRTAVLTPQLCGQIEGRILSWVKGRSKGRLETLVDREVVIADPAAAEQRRIKAVADRSVTHRTDKDGMGVISALLPAEAAVLVFTLVDLIAQANKGLDGRTVDQRRADAVADIADELLTHGFIDLDGLVARADQQQAAAEPAEANTGAVPADPAVHAVPADSVATAVPADSVATAVPADPASDDRAGRLGRVLTRHGRRPHLNVTGAWSTLAGLDDLPGHLDGHGVITAQLLRAIATSWASVTAVGVNPATGTATAVGALTYRPRQQLTDQVILVSGTCRAAGCRMPAWRCDLDHLQPFNHTQPHAGAGTTLPQLIPACRFHHLLKHHTDWAPQLLPDLSIRWTTNTGHHATSHAREFTLPGEWTRDCAASPDEVSRQTAPASDDLHLPAAVAAPARVMIGPTVTGPTIPVHPAGQPFTEPHTELEDPSSVPPPGGTIIHSYRAWRRHTRDRALHRLRNLQRMTDPTEKARWQHIAIRSVDFTDADRTDDDRTDADPTAATELTGSLRLARPHPLLGTQNPPKSQPPSPTNDDDPPF